MEGMAYFFHMMNHFIMYHVTAIWLFFVLLDCFEDDRDVVNVRVFWGGKLAVSVQTHCCVNVILDCCMPDFAALDGFTPNEGNGETSDKVVPRL